MNKTLLLGVPDIDRQHKELFHSLQHLLALGDDAEAASDVLSRLTQQIHHHFDAEEHYMASLDLPERTRREHEAAHLQIVEGMTRIHLDSMFGFRLSVDEIAQRISDYIERHVLEFDLGLKSYIPQLE